MIYYVKLLFRGGSLTTADSRARGIVVTTVNIVGTVFSADYPIPCPAGTISSAPGSTSCTVCPSNTFSHQANVVCSPCSSSQYSFPGASSCSNKLPCTASDYEMIYSACTNDIQTVSYQLVAPITCTPTSQYTPPAAFNISCVPCEVGHYRSFGACVTCLPGQYRNEQLQACVPSSPGNAAILTTGYWNQPLNGTYFPSEFTTGCTGNCICEIASESCNSGWIFESNHTTSGRNHGRQVDTYLSLTVNLDAPEGSVQFQYTVTGSASNGVAFYINDRVAIIPYHPAEATTQSFELVGGLNVLTWWYHQEANTDGTVTLSNIVLTGTGGALFDTSCASGEYSAGGESSYCIPCAPGSYNSHPGAGSCLPCQGESFASDEGASVCIPCGDNTFANSNKTDCSTECHFNFNDREYDLSALQDVHGPFQLTSTPNTGVWVNLCRKRSSTVICVDPTGAPIETYMCEIDSRGNGVDMGHYLSVSYIDSVEPAYIKFTYTYAHSSVCKTTVNLICDPDNHQSIPYELPTSTACSLKLEWPTASACPICVDGDYEVHESACVDGVKTLTTVRASNCTGVIIRDTSTVECPKEYTFSPLFVVVVVVLLVILIAIVGIVTGILLYCCKERNKYMALIKQNEGQYEMKTMDTSLQDDEETTT